MATTDPSAWNRQFETLNNIPAQLKADQAGQQSYYQKLMSDNQAAGGSYYKAPEGSTPPTGLLGGATSPVLGTPSSTNTQIKSTPQTPQQQADFQRGMGITNVGGILTYADQASPATPNDYNPDAVQEEINRRLVLRGLPPQTGPGSAPGTPPAPGGTAPGSTPATGILGTPGYTAEQLGTPTQWNVDKNQTVAGQVEGIIAADSPLQQLARTRAMQQQNDRGTLNTSMAIQAAQAANLDAALPIAQADAALQGRAAAYNSDTANQFAGKNVDAANAALSTTAGINANTARDTAQTLANKAAAEQLAITNKNAAFEKAAADLRLSAANALNDTEVAAFKANLAASGLGQEQSILVSRELTTNINNIQARTDINGDVKSKYIQDAVNRTNATLALIHKASKITGTMLQFVSTEPTISSPAENTPPNSILSGGINRDGTPTD